MNTRVVAIIFLVLLAVAGVISLGISQRNAQQKTQAGAPPNLIDLAEQDISVKLTTEGPVTADELHTSNVIEVSRNTRNLDLYKTYSNTSVFSKTYPNNQTAFEELIYALQRYGFTKTKTGAIDKEPRGYCPAGNRYTYELIQNDQVISSLWSDTCNTKVASFNGSGDTIRALLQRQVPDYNSALTQYRTSQ